MSQPPPFPRGASHYPGQFGHPIQIQPPATFVVYRPYTRASIHVSGTSPAKPLLIPKPAGSGARVYDLRDALKWEPGLYHDVYVRLNSLFR